MEDLTGNSAANADKFLNDAPASTVDETETQSAAEFGESPVETSQGSGEKGSDETTCTVANLGEQNSSALEEASDDAKSSKGVETAMQGSEISNHAGELVNERTPEIENGSNGEGDTTQSHLQSSQNVNGGSAVEVSPTIEASTDTNASEESDSPTQIDITANAIDSSFEPEDEGFEAAKGTGNEVETGNTDPGTAQEQQTLESSLYHIKWIKWKGINTPIITQNENGPCPLLAVVNVLLLQRRIKIPSQQTFITSGQLMEYIGDCILEEAPKVCNSYNFGKMSLNVYCSGDKRDVCTLIG